MEPPVRESTGVYVCRCDMVMWDIAGRSVWVECRAQHTNPDSPFCPGCADRHPGHEVRVRTYVMKREGVVD